MNIESLLDIRQMRRDWFRPNTISLGQMCEYKYLPENKRQTHLCQRSSEAYLCATVNTTNKCKCS